jgi:LysR family glycine cleavage system transcriptional activator
LRTFEAAARLLSFKRAASELQVTPGAVSLQIKSLEAQLGAPLFVRLTLALGLAERGAALLPKVQQGLGVRDEAWRQGKVQAATRPLLLAAMAGGEGPASARHGGRPASVEHRAGRRSPTGRPWRCAGPT